MSNWDESKVSRRGDGRFTSVSRGEVSLDLAGARAPRQDQSPRSQQYEQIADKLMDLDDDDRAAAYFDAQQGRPVTMPNGQLIEVDDPQRLCAWMDRLEHERMHG